MPRVTSHRALSTVTRPQENALQDTLKVGMQYPEQVLPATLGHLQVSCEVMTHLQTATVQDSFVNFTQARVISEEGVLN